MGLSSDSPVNAFTYRNDSMILFKEDWEKYPGAIRQYNTKNKSWIHCREIFHKLGIENCDWHLQLLDPTLIDVDPRDPNLSPEVVAKVFYECYRNPTYVMREVLRVKIKGSDINGFITADRGLLATLWLYMNHIDTTNTQMRQTGKTFKGYCIFIWLIIFVLSNSTVLWSTTTDSKRRDTIKEIRGLIELIPPTLYQPHKFDSKNYEIITNKSRGNVGIFSLAQKDKNAAETNYLGFTVANAIWDEMAEAPNSDISLAAASGSMNAAREQAMRVGAPNGTIMLCTAPNLLKKEGKNYYAISKSGPQWTDIFYDCKNREELIETIAINGGDPDIPLVDITMSWRQLGKTEEEFKVILKKTISRCGGDRDIVKRHCYSIPTFGSKDKPVSPAQAEILMNNIAGDYSTEVTPEKAHIRYFESPADVRKLNDLNRLIISIDTSTASGRDSCSITLSDSVTMYVVARCDIKRMMLGMFESMCCRLLTLYDKSVIIIEAKSTGHNLIDAMITKCHSHKIDPFSRLFNRIYQYREKFPKEYDEIKNTPINRRTLEWYAKYKQYFGFSTNATLRKDIYSQCLIEAVERAACKMRDKALIEQLVALETDKNDRVDHPSGGNDDAAISYLIGVWFLMYGRNYTLYGMNPRDILAKAPRGTDGDVSQADIDNRVAITKMEAQVDILAEKLSSTRGTPLGDKYIELIERINQELAVAGTEIRNIDTLLASLKENKTRG